MLLNPISQSCQEDVPVRSVDALGAELLIDLRGDRDGVAVRFRLRIGAFPVGRKIHAPRRAARARRAP